MKLIGILPSILQSVLSVILLSLLCLSCGGGHPVGPNPSPSIEIQKSPDQPVKYFPPGEKPPAKHVILIIGDGMHLEHEIAASRYITGSDEGLSFQGWDYQTYVTTWDVDTYNRFAYANGGAKYTSLDNINPVLGYNVSLGGWAPYPICDTGLANYFLTALPAWGGGGASNPATDSASAATAMSCGVKTDAGNIAWMTGDPPDGELQTIAEKARVEGYAMGVVTTVPFSHATPAAFVSHNISRNNYLEIAHEIITDTRPDVVIGGGNPSWQTGYISTSDYNVISADPGYVFCKRATGGNGGEILASAAAQAVAQGKKLFGLFGGAGGNFESPKPSDGVVGFTLQEENPQLGEVATAALEVLSTDPEGFFLMIEQGDIDWANHANDFARMVGTVWDLDECVKAVDEFIDKTGDDVTWENTLVIVTADHSNSYMRLITPMGQGELPLQEPSGGSYHYPDGEVTYGSGGHTNEPVMLYARGAGMNLFSPYEGEWYPGTKLIDNTRVYKVMAEYIGVQ